MKKKLTVGLLFISCATFAQVNIYNTDGALTSNRTVAMDSKNLTIKPSTENSQFFINGTSGNTGLGTSTPSSKLDVIGVVKAQSLLATNSVSSFANSLEWYKNSNVLGAGYEMTDVTVSGATRRMLNFYDSNAYGSIASTNESFTLNVVDRGNKERLFFSGYEAGGTSNGKSYFVLNDKNGSENFKIIDDGNQNIGLQMGKVASKFIIGGFINYEPAAGHKFIVKGGSALVEGNILTDANVGIGTSSFSDGTDTYRLSVFGAIRAHSVKVYTTWADYVFEKNYQLPTLEQVEQHIKEKGHLKDIPSAKEVETNGIELGKMNKLLLQKVEELTLYIIELDKELKEVKSQLKKT